jgi:hypothetical protein
MCVGSPLNCAAAAACWLACQAMLSPRRWSGFGIKFARGLTEHMGQQLATRATAGVPANARKVRPQCQHHVPAEGGEGRRSRS